MAELNNRTAKELDFAKRLVTAFSDYRERIAGYEQRGEPIPDAAWLDMEADAKKKIAVILLLLFTDSATQHGGDLAAGIQAGTPWALARSEQVGRELVDTSRQWQADGRSLDEIFSSQRAANVAVTETTVATSAGGEWGVRTTVGLSVLDTWYTVEDARVCKICGPLHGVGRDVWERQFPQGPPGHVNCRCWLSYANANN